MAVFLDRVFLAMFFVVINSYNDNTGDFVFWIY